MAKKAATIFACIECGAQAAKWLGRCPDCNAWNSFAEEESRPLAQAVGLSASAEPVPLGAVGADVAPRISTNLPSLDRVLGGGLVAGAVALVGGEPGIGKSTLLLQVAEQLADEGPVLYVSGEESPRQIALRAKRLGIMHDNIRLYAETSVEKINDAIEKLRPVIAIVDSIQ